MAWLARRKAVRVLLPDAAAAGLFEFVQRAVAAYSQVQVELREVHGHCPPGDDVPWSAFKQ